MDDIEHNAYECSRCGRGFTTEKALNKHNQRKIPCDRKLQCAKCGKIFDKMSNYNRHMEERKTPCEPIVNGEPPVVNEGENKCEFCGRKFTTIKRLENHRQKYCKVAQNKKVYASGEFKPGMEVLQQTLEKRDRQNTGIDGKEESKEELKEEIRRLREQLQSVQPTTVNQINIDKLQINQTIIINSFDSKQSFDHIDVKEAISALRLDFDEIFPKLTHLIHGDEKAKQNHNIYLPNLKTDRVMILEEREKKRQWRDSTLREIFPVLMKRGVDLLYKADDDLSAMGQILTDEEGDRFEMLINKQRSNTIDDEDIEKIKPILYKMKMLPKPVSTGLLT